MLQRPHRVVAVVLLVGLAQAGVAFTGDRSADKADVRALALKFVATFQSQRPTPFEQFEEMLAEDVVGVMSDGVMVDGKEALSAFYKDHLGQIRNAFSSTTLSYDIKWIKLGVDSAVVFGLLEISGRLKEGDKRIARKVWETLVFRRDSSGWRLILEHSTQTTPFETETH